MNCPNCGGNVPPGVNRCLKCGSFVEQQAPPPPQPAYAPVAQVVMQAPMPVQPAAVPMTPEKSRIAAGLLAIFLGAFGIHNFYLGNVGIGVTQLLLTLLVSWFTCGLSAMVAGIWALVEGILLLVGGINRDGEGRPLK